MNQIATSIPTDVRERIIQAANDLYEQANRQSFPTVDQVRRHARVDMNAASAIMREWRCAQSVYSVPVVVHLPDSVIQANNQLLTTLWAQAQELANESLRAAKSAWDAERKELDEMRQELANAFEVQAAEFDLLKNQAAEEAKLAANELACVQIELSQALQFAADAREHSAELVGKLSAMHDQNKELLSRFIPSGKESF